MRLKTLTMALVSIPLLSFAVGNGHEKVIRPAKQTVETAQATDKLILVISQSGTGMATDILENRHTSRFLDANFVIEQQTNPGVQDLYLIFNQRQELIHRVANEPYPYELAVKIKRALDPDMQYYTLLARFDKGERSAALLKHLIIGASDADDRRNAPRFMQAYLDSQESPMTPATIRLLAKYTKASSEPGFALLLNDIAVADNVLGSGKTAEKLAAIIFEDAFAPYLSKNSVDISTLTDNAKTTYPSENLRNLIDGLAIQFLEMRGDWDDLKLVLPAYLSNNGSQLSTAMRDYYNWLTAEHLSGS